MKQFISLLVALAVSGTFATQSQTVHGVTGAVAWMQGGTGSVSNDAFSVLNNPSLISWMKNWQSGVYHEKRFNRRELSLSSVAVAIPTHITDIGVAISSYGFSNFNEQRFTFSAAKKLAQTLSLGVQVNYVQVNMNEYGQAGTWVIGAGVNYQPASKILVGFSVYNPNQRQLQGQLGVQLPAIARLGAQYRINAKVHTQLEAEQQTNHKASIKGGLRYDLHKRVSAAAGASSSPVTYSFGASVKFAGGIIDMAAGVHQVLGVTPRVSLRYPSAY
jgi:hypothetical protein